MKKYTIDDYKEINIEMMDRATRMLEKGYDREVFNIFCKCIDNVKDFETIEAMANGNLTVDAIK